MEWISEIAKQYGIQGVILILLILKMFNHDKHSNDSISDEHKEQKELLIKILEKQTEAKEVLIRMEEHLRYIKNGASK